MDVVFRLLDKAKVPLCLQGLWRLINGAAPLREIEIKTARSLFGSEWVSFTRVLIAQGGFLPLVFRWYSAPISSGPPRS